MHKGKSDLACPVCRSGLTDVVLTRVRTPTLQNARYEEQREANAAPVGKLTLNICADCGFGFNSSFEPNLVHYDARYENNQAVSPKFEAHLDSICNEIFAVAGSSARSILEVGCGQGTFLSRLNDRQPQGNIKLWGVDPAYRVGEGSLPTGLVILPQSLSRNLALPGHIPPDIVIIRHVIEHIPDPVLFLQLIAETACWGASTTLFVETPCLDWILRHNVLQDIFYEHVNYFTADTLALAVQSAGFEVQKVNHVFGDQYIFLEAKYVGGSNFDSRGGSQVLSCARRYAAAVEKQIEHWREALSGAQPTAIWGAGAKGITFANLIDPEAKLISCIIDINQEKQGCYAAVSAHPIVAPETAAALGIERAIIMNPEYRHEIECLLQEADLAIELVADGSEG